MSYYRRRRMEGTVEIIGGLVAIIIAGVVWFGSIASERSTCIAYGEITGRQVQYRRVGWFNRSCFVRTENGQWIDRDQLREVIGD